MSNIEVESTATIELDEIADALGEQYILEGEDRGFVYLAALALETRDNESYDLERTLMEFMRNCSELDLTREECDEIEALLR